MADNTSIKIVQYKMLSETYPFCFANDELWTTTKVITSLFNISSKKLKQINTDIRTQIYHESTVNAKDFPEAGYSSGKVHLINANVVLAVGYKVDNDKASRLNRWIKDIMKKEGIFYQEQADPDIVGRGRIYIQYGEMQEAIYNTDVYFSNTYHDEWLMDPYIKKIIKDIDNIEKEFNLEAKIYAKLEYFNPAGSVKDRVAKKMIDDAEKAGKLKADAICPEPITVTTLIIPPIF